MSQTLKLETCSGACVNCNVLGIAQRRIGNRQITDETNMIAVARQLQLERCPEGQEMKIGLLNPANLSRQNLADLPTWF
ncbi:MAG: hypothetical protein WCV93_03345 [Candidatus Shapirobacteria bacterium]|jgi:hypothetical protein